MTDYTELVKSLRHLSTGRCDNLHGCEPCAIYETCLTRCVLDAAAAIEELQQKWFKSETDATNLTGKLAQAEADIDRLNLEIDKRIATEIELSNQVDALQAENTDIREELFISQRKYDEFTTIASMQNAMLAKQLPKRGEIVRCGECKHRKDSIQCPLWSEGIETADDWFCADGEREVQE